MRWIKRFEELGLSDLPLVGGKNASLGEMIRELSPLGVAVPGGFAVTAEAYWHFVRENNLEAEIRRHLEGIDKENVVDLEHRGAAIRALLLGPTLPPDLSEELRQAYREMSPHDERAWVAVRSSATAEDLPTASFAGQQESYLHVHGEQELETAVRRCFASLFTTRAMAYRIDMGFDHMDVGLSVGVQQMVMSGKSSSGVMFTLDTESGADNVVMINSIWGLGENIVQGRVVPDEFYVHKSTLRQGFKPILRKKCGAKEFRLLYDHEAHRLKNERTTDEERSRLSLEDDDVLTLARWAMAIEDHYDKPMDIEWAKDADTGKLYIVQARPETVESQKGPAMSIYRLTSSGKVLAQGLAVGQKIAVGKARVVKTPADMHAFGAGEVLVTENTDPDWEPVMKKAAAIVTESGGRTSHAAIVARELGIPALVGVAGACQAVASGQEVTVSCAEGPEGRIYEGALEFEVERVNLDHLRDTRTQIMINLADPEQALRISRLPNRGVGLVRMEFVFSNWVRVHPLALTRYESLPRELRLQIDRLTQGYASKTEYFVDRLARGLSMIAGAFHPRPVILRFSDFKTNEYRNLLGGHDFEPEEENPMLGWRGASRYYHPEFKEGFLLEVEAVKRVREVMGLTNLKVMIPFCRTPEEGRRVLETMAEGGLERGRDGLEVYVMAELPANVLRADEFAELFDGFSIGSNDLTQLVLGVDRDSAQVAELFDERDAGVKRACAMIIEAAKKAGIKVGICGQAPSDYPDFAAFLVELGIDSISLTPDAVLSTSLAVAKIEDSLKAAT